MHVEHTKGITPKRVIDTVKHTCFFAFNSYTEIFIFPSDNFNSIFLSSFFSFVEIQFCNTGQCQRRTSRHVPTVKESARPRRRRAERR